MANGCGQLRERGTHVPRSTQRTEWSGRPTSTSDGREMEQQRAVTACPARYTRLNLQKYTTRQLYVIITELAVEHFGDTLVCHNLSVKYLCIAERVIRYNIIFPSHNCEKFFSFFMELCIYFKCMHEHVIVVRLTCFWRGQGGRGLPAGRRPPATSPAGQTPRGRRLASCHSET